MNRCIRGEVRISVKGRPRNLVPTFRAIEAIASSTSVSVKDLLLRHARGDVRFRDLAAIVYEGLGAPDWISPAEVVDDALDNFESYWKGVGEFLINACGGPLDPEKHRDAPPPAGSPSPSMREQFNLAAGLLKVPSSEFWEMTPMELDAMCEAHMKAHPRYVEPITRNEIEALKAKHPDKGRKRNGPH